jgi:integrase
MKQKGYIYYDKQEDCWYARVTITDGKGKRRNLKKRAKDKSVAKEILKSLLGEIEEKGCKAIDATRMSFNDLANYYQSRYLKPAEYVEGRKIAGLRDVDRPLECLKHFREYFGKKKLREITYGDIYAFRSLRLQTPTHYKRPRTIGSWNREASVLRRIFNIALREGWINKNPFNSGDPLIIVSFERRRERILTLDEERRLLEACEHPQRKHLRRLIICLLDTGARKSEMLKLRWRAVCFTTRIITIEGMTTKTLKTRHVAMTARMYEELWSLWEASSREPDGLVFGITSNVRNSFKSVCKDAGIKQGGIDGLTLHSLRHTAATRLVKGQMPLQMVGRILGHSQPQTTYRYLSANAETATQAAAILDAFQANSSNSLSEKTENTASEMVN